MTETSIKPPENRRGGPRRVAGLSVRTRNADEGSGDTAQIPGLWGRFSGEDWFGRLERLGARGPRVAVYSDYESDGMGVYRLLVGRETPAGTVLGPGIETADVAGGEYLVLACRGPIPGVVIAGWSRVWEFFSCPGALRRAFTADLEVYDADGGGLEIWVAVERSGSPPAAS
ncbi:MAG TPA: GyrI-like domain-containing protein [Gemmatimonadales bacterium]